METTPHGHESSTAPRDAPVRRTIVVTDLSGSQIIKKHLQLQLGGAKAASRIENEIMELVEEARGKVGGNRCCDLCERMEGDAVILAFHEAEVAEDFASRLHWLADEKYCRKAEDEFACRCFHVGICTGYVSIDGGHIAGVDVGHAKRLEEKAGSGETMIDRESLGRLPHSQQYRYGPVETFTVKNGQELEAARRVVVAPAPWEPRRAPEFDTGNSGATFIRLLVGPEEPYQTVKKILRSGCEAVFLHQRSSSLILGPEGGKPDEASFVECLIDEIRKGLKLYHVVNLDGIKSHRQKRDASFPRIVPALNALTCGQPVVGLPSPQNAPVFKALSPKRDGETFSPERQAGAFIARRHATQAEGVFVFDVGRSRTAFHVGGSTMLQLFNTSVDEFNFHCHPLYWTDLAACMPDLVDERVILVHDDDAQRGTALKFEAHGRRELHRAFSVFIFRRDGGLLVQQRSHGKYHSADLWSNTCCGHPRPEEETRGEAARRLREEMGIDDCNLTEMGNFIYNEELSDGVFEYELDHVFAGFLDDDHFDPTYDREEVQNHDWWTPGEVDRRLSERTQELTAWFSPAWQVARRILTG